MSETRNTYDEIPYTSHVFPQSHPIQLASLAKLFGMDAPPVENCRVLELGCSMGNNLVAMAQNHPGSQFLGVDSSARQVADGWKSIQSLGLKNVRLQHLDILEIAESFGEFDYIVVHGVFSWVPPAVQNKILEICQRHLVPNGVAYISYNTYPGWHIREIVREMMRYRSTQFRDPATRLAQAKSLVKFVVQSRGTDDDPYCKLLQAELTTLSRSHDYYLHHEHLEENNHPIYFHEFARKLGVNGLQYLGDADVATMVATNLGQDIAKTLQELGANDIVQSEQYMDFLRCRFFRHSLICHSSVRLNRQLRSSLVKGLQLASQAEPESAHFDHLNTDPESFCIPEGRGITCRSPLIKAALRRLLQQWPMPLSFADLHAHCEATIPHIAGDAGGLSREDFLATELLTCLAAGVVEWHLGKPPYTTSIDEYPLTIPSARAQAAVGNPIVNVRGEFVELDAFHRRLLQHLDGKRNRAQLIEALLRHVQEGGHELRRDDQSPVTDPEEMRVLLANAVELALQNLAKHAFLCRK